jgi:hypothetical protein
MWSTRPEMGVLHVRPSDFRSVPIRTLRPGCRMHRRWPGRLASG